jgi:hypothetical protein
MEPNPIRTASHIGLWIAVIGLVVFLAWSAVNKKSETNEYQKGSDHLEAGVTNNYYPLSLGFGGCVALRPDGTPINKKK